MADLTILETDVLPPTGASNSVVKGTAGESIDAGEAVFVDTADGNKVKLAGKATEATSKGAGIALHSSEAGQPLSYASKGTLALGAGVVAAGDIIVLSAGGGMSPAADLLSGDWVCVVGVGQSDGTLKFDFTMPLQADSAIA